MRAEEFLEETINAIFDEEDAVIEFGSQVEYAIIQSRIQ